LQHRAVTSIPAALQRPFHELGRPRKSPDRLFLENDFGEEKKSVRTSAGSVMMKLFGR
jgi:hypothetical protein